MFISDNLGNTGQRNETGSLNVLSWLMENSIWYRYFNLPWCVQNCPPEEGKGCPAFVAWAVSPSNLYIEDLVPTTSDRNKKIRDVMSQEWVP